jgi:hypothetical protein
MNPYITLFFAALATYLTNIPFGYWRANARKFSWQWFLFVHLPIPLVVAYRFLFELGFQFYTYPFMILAFFFGQWTGAKIRKSKIKQEF